MALVRANKEKNVASAYLYAIEPSSPSSASRVFSNLHTYSGFSILNPEAAKALISGLYLVSLAVFPVDPSHSRSRNVWLKRNGSTVLELGPWFSHSIFTYPSTEVYVRPDTYTATIYLNAGDNLEVVIYSHTVGSFPARKRFVSCYADHFSITRIG